jgi:hypothetical protein
MREKGKLCFRPRVKEGILLISYNLNNWLLSTLRIWDGIANLWKHISRNRVCDQSYLNVTSMNFFFRIAISSMYNHFSAKRQFDICI